MAKQVKSVYGDALFELAIEESKVDVLYDEVRFMRQVLAENKDLVAMMTHPRFHRRKSFLQWRPYSRVRSRMRS